jgi:hypothetical protein
MRPAGPFRRGGASLGRCNAGPIPSRSWAETIMPKAPAKGGKRRGAPQRKTAKAPSAIEALERLVDAPAEERHIHRLFIEMFQARNDRGAAILLGTYLETALEEAIESAMHIRHWQRRRFFGLTGLLSSFANKTLMAYALDIIGSETFANLDHIRRIRNAFAHSKVHVSFKTKEIKAVCALLKMPIDISPWPWHPRSGNAREIYSSVCYITSKNLRMWKGHAMSPPIMKYPWDKWGLINREWPELPMPALRDSELFLRRKPLP